MSAKSFKNERQLMFVRFVLTHAQYTKGDYKNDCDG